MDLSIIIVNWNTRKLLDRCLSAVYETVRRSAEVIVVDNGSRDGSAEWVNERYPDCILIRNRRNLGFAEANNQGMRIARGRYILLLNSDAKPLPGCLDGLVDYLEAHPAHGAVAPQLLNEDGSIQQSCSRLPTFLTLLVVHTTLRFRPLGKRLMDRLYMRDWNHASNRDVEQPKASCLLLRADVVRRVGLFDTGCFLLYNDVDLCKRIWNAGWRIGFASLLRCIHTESASLDRYVRLNEERLRNVMHYIAKHYGPLMAWFFYILTLTDVARLGLGATKT